MAFVGLIRCVLLIDDRNRKRLAAELDQAVEQLRYGGIGINVWPGTIYGLTTPTWGAFAGHPPTPTDIQSGAGVVHNTFLFEYPQKSVLWAPFVVKPTPAYFADHRNLHLVGRRMLDYEAKPTLPRFVKVAAAAMRA